MQVEVVLSLPGSVSAHVTVDAEKEVEWPQQPAKYGEGTMPGFAGLPAVLGVRPPACHLPSRHSPDVEQQEAAPLSASPRWTFVPTRP
ncbi:hypothetical protein AB0B30_32245 [Streptomyces narbonensis]|uniref:hypothetical protein n=1 Tax=Streptomyces narbonensis TaxID=67333 RepID=UPI0033D6475C